MLGNFTEITNETTSVVIDIETVDPYLKISGASWAQHEGHILGIACKIDDEPSGYFPVGHDKDNYDRDKCKVYFNDMFKLCYEQDIPLIMHYGYYDLGWLDHEGFLDITKCPPLFDTFIGGQLYNSRMAFALKSMAQFFGIGAKMDIDVEQLRIMPVPVVAKYACGDTDLTGRLYDKLMPSNINPEAVMRENGVIPITVMMKKYGIPIDMEALEIMDKDYEIKLNNRMKILYQHDPQIKLWSGDSVEFLFRRLGLGYPRTEHGNPSFTQDFLEEVGKTNPTVQALSEARKLQKLRSTFLEGIRRAQVNGVVHPDYYNGRSEHGGTITGRLSSANPNIQQVPSRTEEGMAVRGLFVPPDLVWMRGDYSQQEPRMMLHYASVLELTGIKKWEELYDNNPDQDFYDTLKEFTGIQDRFVMKTNSLALSYGMGVPHMAEILGIPVETATMYKEQFQKSVPWLIELSNMAFNKAVQSGQIKTIGDRYLKFTQNTASKAFNHMIQGSAADQIKQAMIDIYKITGKVPLCTVHDELDYSLNEQELEDELDQTIAQIMKDAFKLQFPTKVDVTTGLNWRECCEK